MNIEQRISCLTGALVLIGLAPAVLQAQLHEVVLHNFQPNELNSPVGNLVVTPDAIYGATYYSGVGGGGGIYKFDAVNHYTVLYEFTGGHDGKWPSGVVSDGLGNLYGATQTGGAYSCGVVFQLDSSGGITCCMRSAVPQMMVALPQPLWSAIQRATFMEPHWSAALTSPAAYSSWIHLLARRRHRQQPAGGSPASRH